ncbi:hypothetical protein [Porphyromonas cangingivalis]|uniref:Uncharacterized protein n=1 Tax=Porphyromonas cangingivalis TaxID=36874 RepID=A0A0A2ES01_PORCN|nr:hypothetical protein [Porphyromonas cangingivalis]KGN80417.1 hypothetical protein HQ35_05485 [Porphyromonas cangingivalis]
MKVTVNGEEIHVYEGARAGDAVRTYLSDRGDSTPLSSLHICDRWGNEIDHDGSINSGAQLIVTINTDSINLKTNK